VAFAEGEALAAVMAGSLWNLSYGRLSEKPRGLK
jgi:hypothetical protein